MACQCDAAGMDLTSHEAPQSNFATTASKARRAHLSTHCSGSTTQPRCCSRRSLASLVPGLSLARYLQEGRR